MKIAVVGDIHCAWGPEDTAYFNGSDYAALLITGDLPGLRHGQAYEVARGLSALTLPSVMIPGNHDATTLPQLLADLAGVTSGLVQRPTSHQARIDRLAEALGPVALGSYSAHELGDDVSLVVARPHAQGGGLSFPAYLASRYGVRSMTESTERLIAAVDACEGQRLVFLGHNGPSGLGGDATDIWGCDFKREGGDWGDPDLEAAVAHARQTGRQVLAVVAGHMHHTTRGCAERIWLQRREGTAYVNAARVPRVFGEGPDRVRHHVALHLESARCEVEAVLVPDLAD